MKFSDLEDEEEEKVYDAAFMAAPVGKENEAAEMAIMQHRAKKKKKAPNMFEQRKKAIDRFF